MNNNEKKKQISEIILSGADYGQNYNPTVCNLLRESKAKFDETMKKLEASKKETSSLTSQMISLSAQCDVLLDVIIEEEKQKEENNAK